MGVEAVALIGVSLYIIALALALLPVKCGHPCVACAEEKRVRELQAQERQRNSEEDTHDWVHRTMLGKSPCPRCKDITKKDD